MTLFEEAFAQFVRATLGELVRDEVTARVEVLRGSPWVSRENACQLLACSKRSLARHTAADRVATSKPFGSPLLIERQNIDELIEASRMLEQNGALLGCVSHARSDRPSHRHNVAAGKLGQERRQQRAAGVYDDITRVPARA